MLKNNNLIIVRFTTFVPPNSVDVFSVPLTSLTILFINGVARNKILLQYHHDAITHKQSKELSILLIKRFAENVTYPRVAEKSRNWILKEKQWVCIILWRGNGYVFTAEFNAEFCNFSRRILVIVPQNFVMAWWLINNSHMETLWRHVMVWWWWCSQSLYQATPLIISILLYYFIILWNVESLNHFIKILPKI